MLQYVILCFIVLYHVARFPLQGAPEQLRAPESGSCDTACIYIFKPILPTCAYNMFYIRHGL